jgi:hypothetical protein
MGKLRGIGMSVSMALSQLDIQGQVCGGHHDGDVAFSYQRNLESTL